LYKNSNDLTVAAWGMRHQCILLANNPCTDKDLVTCPTPERGFLQRLTVQPFSGQGLDIVYARDLTGRMTGQDSSVNTEDWLYQYDSMPDTEKGLR
jgi:hypothetical protein